MRVFSIFLFFILLFSCKEKETNVEIPIIIKDEIDKVHAEPNEITSVQEAEISIIEEIEKNNEPFSKTLTQNDISFTVSCANSNSLNALKITPKGFTNNNEETIKEINGTLHKTEIADLNNDGYPEIYCFTYSNDDIPKGTVHAFSSYKNKSYGEIYMVPNEQHKKLFDGYAGNDQFSIEGHFLVRSFSILNKNSNIFEAEKRQIVKYQLIEGEASYLLKPVVN